MHQRELVGLASVGVRGKLLADSSDPRCRTRGTRLQRPRSPARSLHQLKYVTIDTDNKHR